MRIFLGLGLLVMAVGCGDGGGTPPANADGGADVATLSDSSPELDGDTPIDAVVVDSEPASDALSDTPPLVEPTLGSGACAADPGARKLCMDIDGTTTDLPQNAFVAYNGALFGGSTTGFKLAFQLPSSWSPGVQDCSTLIGPITWDIITGAVNETFIAGQPHKGFCKMEIMEFGTAKGNTIRGTFTAIFDDNASGGTNKFVGHGSFHVIRD
jgi:hypothetical protein